MANFKKFELNALISVPEEMDQDTFVDVFLELIESNGWSCCASLNGHREENIEDDA